jgi:hypothetical protein
MNEHLVLPPQRRVNMRYQPVFLQRWWLKIVGEYCESVNVTGSDGLVQGSFLYWSRRNRLGLPFGYNPPLSHLAGFTFSPRLGPLEQCRTIDELIAQLPRSISFHFVFSSTGPNADHIRHSFQQAGFTSTTHKTYLRPPSECDVLSGIRNPVHRRRISSADRRLRVEAINVEEFLTLYDRNLRAAGKKINWSIDIARKLLQEGIRRQQIYLLAVSRNRADDPRAEYDAAMACVCDPAGERLYYWMSTRSHTAGKNKPHRDASKVLVKRAMEYAQSRDWIFDADGASTAGAENFQKNSLGLSLFEERDVFMRLTTSAQAYEGWRPSIKRIFASLSPIGQGSKLQRAKLSFDIE